MYARFQSLGVSTYNIYYIDSLDLVTVILHYLELNFTSTPTVQVSYEAEIV